MRSVRRSAQPDGYPAEYEASVRLKDGRAVQIRPIVPADAAELADAIRTADPETLHARFLGAAPPVTDALLTKLTCVDYVTAFALVARHRGHGVAIARYTALPPEPDGCVPAEIAVAVAPDWRGVGLATALIGMLARRGSECGISAFTALFGAQNRPVAELAREGNARVSIEDGTASLEASLGEQGK
jgi:GNAT superfamily N-acetyltransferase